MADRANMILTRSRRVQLTLGTGFLAVVMTSLAGCPARPAPSPRPDVRTMSAVKLGEVLLRDNFDDAGTPRLPLVSDDPGVDQGYVGGEYLIRLSPFAQGPSRFVGPSALFANVHVAAEARLIGGTEGRWVGLVCRLTMEAGRASGFYVLGVSPALGSFGLERHDAGGISTRLVPFQASSAIRRGNASNYLELACVGTTLAVRINGVEVASARDDRYDKGLVALVAGRPSASSLTVESRFDDLVVKEAFEP